MSDPSQRLQDALAGRYRIQRELGQGGMATVFLAEDLKHHRQVAIKVLDPEVAAAIGPERFLREIETVAGLSHPHILPLHDSGVADGFLFYVMPFAEGESLRDRLRREPQLPLDEAVGIAREIADGLGYAHAQGVVHRDIKPENVLLQGGHALLADFGIARAAGASETAKLTSTGVMIGTPAYMSPEQAAGSSRIDGRADLYSLGCVVHEMLAGQPPFTGATADSVIHQHLAVEPPRVTDLRPGVPEPVATVVRRLLAKSPADRFADTAEFSRALVKSLTAESASVRSGTLRSHSALVVILASLALVLGLSAVIWWSSRPPAGGRIAALAVLPLVNLSGDSSQEYFADGMTEELTDALARIGSLRIISRTSAMSFKGTKLRLPEIARKLNVDAIIEGTVARAGSRVRITADLVRARPERHLWGDRYEREVEDVLALQAEVAQTIARQVRAQVKPEERARLERPRQVNAEAHEAYLKGRYYLNRLDQKWLRTALDYFQKSVRIDSTYAQAWAGMADAYYELSNIYLPPKQAIPLAKAAAEKAVRLDPELADGHAALGVIHAAYDWDWVAAEREYRRSLELNPSHAQGHLYYGQLLEIYGRMDEAIAQWKLAVELNPLSTYTKVTATYALYLAGRYPEAIAELKKLEQVEPDYAPIHFNLAQVYEEMGRHDEAIAEARRALAVADWPYARAILVCSLARAGRGREALDQFARFKEQAKKEHVSSVVFAQVYTSLGKKDEAFRSLERAYENRDEDLPYINTDPKMADLRSDPRFHDLLRRMGLEG